MNCHSKLKLHFVIIFALCSANFCFAYEIELQKESDSSNQEKKYAPPAFTTLQIGNLQSTTMADKKDLHLVVAHRFGSIRGGIKELFGLDQANTKIQLLYGISNRLQLGVSRDSYEKTYSGTAKLNCLQQSDKTPFNLVLYASVDVNTLLSNKTYPGLLFFDRFAYTTQLLVSRRFSEKLSLEIAPIYVRQNLINLNYTMTTFANPQSPRDFFSEPWNQYLLAIGGKYKLTKGLFVNVDYAYNFSKKQNSLYKNPLTIGASIETFGHAFQLFFSNARGSNDSSFLTETRGDWSKGDISFGFNVVRVF